jgi:hypothetical protein
MSRATLSLVLMMLAGCTAPGTTPHTAALPAGVVQQALETVPAGEVVSWQAPDGRQHGTVMPIRTFRTTVGYCREYAVTLITPSGLAQDTWRDVACRDEAGVWRDAAIGVLAASGGGRPCPRPRCQYALLDGPVEAVGKEAEARAGATEIDDVQHLPGATREGEPVAVGRNDVGVVGHLDALIPVTRTVQTVARVGNRMRCREQAKPVQKRADLAGVVSLDREQAGRSL